MFGAVCSTSREGSCRRMHMGSWGIVLRYDLIRSIGILSEVLTEEEPKDLSG